MSRETFITTWSRFPLCKARVYHPRNLVDLQKLVSSEQKIIPYGLGRSYGDAPLGKNVIKSYNFSFFHDFDSKNGILVAEAGVSIQKILEYFVPRGWFLPVTPGTKFVTLGGAVAADVHGKNHHLAGSFCNWVEGIWLFLPNGEEIFCSSDKNSHWFQMTCGGMGLTGFITKVKLKLKKIKSVFIKETIIKCSCLEESLEIFEAHSNSLYTVSWLDCTSQGKSFGRSLFLKGDHCEDGILSLFNKKNLKVPFEIPSSMLNSYSISLFNTIYYYKHGKKIGEHKIHYEKFFYPLDSIENWNRLYGKNGFLQYQFVVPKEDSKKVIKEVLKRIKRYKETPFLSVLKLLGNGNKFPLSFPMSGYTLALDFKLTPKVFSLFRELDEIVHYYGGRIYLAKDARVGRSHFEQGYPKFQEFIDFRVKNDLKYRIESKLSERLGL